MNQSQAQAALVTLLEDTLQQVSAGRLTAAISEAWNDAWVAQTVWDTSSLTYTSSAYQYAVPTTMTTVDAIYLQRTTSQGPERVSADLYEVINGQIIFGPKAVNVIPNGQALQVRGHKKLGSGDSIDASNVTLQNYVVTLAGYIVLKYMGYSKVLSFLRNDTSLSELMAFRNTIQQDMLNYKKQLQIAYVDN